MEICTFHSFVLWQRVPMSTVLLSCVTLTSLLVKCTSHPASHSIGTDSSACFTVGNTCVVQADGGSVGIFSVAV